MELKESLPIDIPITDDRLQLWEELGLSEKAREQEMEDLKNAFRTVYHDSLDKLAWRCQQTRNEIQKIQTTHQRAMKAFGVGDSEISRAITPIQPFSLLEQLEGAKKAYDGFRTACADRIQKLENLVQMASKLFDQLGVPEDARGEFSEVGEIDFSRDRMERFRKKIQELKDTLEARTKHLLTLKSSIRELLGELGSELSPENLAVFDSGIVDSETISRCEAILADLESVKRTRVAQITQFAIEITHLWDLLGVSDAERAAFLRSHSTISEKVLISCSNEVTHLCKLRDERLPELIEKQKREVEDLWSKLHIAVESRPRFCQENGQNDEDGTVVAEFLFYEAEIIRLKKMMVSLHPLLSLINDREDIISEFEAVSQMTNDATRLLSREKGSAQQLMREEKARRRHKVVLPRLEKKLYVMLKTYKHNHGADFEWDGVPYIDKLANVTPPPRLVTRKKTAPLPGETAAKCRTLPASPLRKVRFVGNENVNAQQIHSLRGGAA
jgi:hypothetical protein